MLYSDTPQLELTLDRADGRYALSFSHSPSTYPVSCGRGTPYNTSHPQPTTTSSTSTSAQSSLPQDMEGRSHLKYPIPDMREVQPGVLASGQWTINHPFVDAYLAALARLAPKQRPQQGPGASVPSTAATSPVAAPHALPDAHSHTHAAASALVSRTPSALSYSPHADVDKLRWRAHHGGIASALTVAQVITVQYELFPGPGSAWYAAQVSRLSEEQKKAVFALAALKVLNHPTHPAHWALWAKNVLRRTAQVVEEVFQLKPCPIVSHVGWLGLPESVWALQGLQSTFVPPPPPQPEKPKAGGMTLRKRKAQAQAPAASSHSSSSSTLVGEDVALRVSPRKRQRTTRAQASLAQAQEDASSVATTAAATPSEATSMLLDVPLPTASGAGAGITRFVKREQKQEQLADIPGASPALQPLELGLALPDTAASSSSSAPQESSGLGATSARRSPASMSPSATRRSTRARRKPAQGPVTLSSASSGSTPLSALSTPAAMSPVPLPLHDSETRHGQAHATKQSSKHSRAGSCGSSTAVSEAGEASEGTVVDLDVDTIETAAAGRDAKGKRKAAELELDDDCVEPAAEAALAEKPQEAAPAAAPKARKAAKKGRGKTAGSGSARPKKRVKLDDAPAVLSLPETETVPELEASGEENVPPVPVAASQGAAKKKAAGGGGATSAKRKTAVRKA
ncbi:hypothetical protein BV20DRAFT_1049893 [Pilatotrama ljubarskyi]|nr:hypothetical protein BV20DRAFT_1049893 [Pilatotrama ljubarskyi]